MKKSSMKGIFLLAVILAAVLSLFYRKTEEEGLLQTGKELEEELPICRVQTKEQNIALTFEVTYETDQVSEILELLAQHGGGASFLLQGNGRRNIRNWRNGFWNRDVMWDFWDMNAMI